MNKGISKGDVTIGIGHVPGYKRPCLFIQEGVIINKCASFTDEEEAERFFKVLADFCGLKGDEIKNEFN